MNNTTGNSNNIPHDSSLVTVNHRRDGRTSSNNNNNNNETERPTSQGGIVPHLGQGSRGFGLSYLDPNRVGSRQARSTSRGCIVSGATNSGNNLANMMSMMAFTGATETSNTTFQMRGTTATGARADASAHNWADGSTASSRPFASQPNNHSSYVHTNINNGSINNDNSTNFSIINNDNSTINNNRFVHAPTSNRTTINNPAPAAAAAAAVPPAAVPRAAVPRAAHAPAQNNERRIFMVPIADSRRSRGGSPHCRACLTNLREGGTYCRHHSEEDEKVEVRARALPVRNED